jgi:F-type H+-transporting ATPase subunit g
MYTDLMLVSQPIAKRVGGLAFKELGPPSPAQWPQIQKGQTLSR